VITGFLLVLLTAMKELPATLMLRPTGFDTLATEIWAATAISQYGKAAPYALLLVLIAAVPTYLLARPDRAQVDQSRENVGL
jgi:iron(III) transport system permease protein